MTVVNPTTGEQAIDNLRDTNRQWPSSAIAERMLTSLNGATIEKITGPAAGATVKLSRPATAIIAILSYITANGNLVAVEGLPNVVSAFKLETTHWTAVLDDPTGVAALTEAASEDNSTNTWVVVYNAKTSDSPVNETAVSAGS